MRTEQKGGARALAHGLAFALALSGCATVQSPAPVAPEPAESERKGMASWQKILVAWALLGVVGLVVNASGDPAQPEAEGG